MSNESTVADTNSIVSNYQNVARRVLAAEFNEATEEVKEDGERGARYALLPSMGKANRVHAVGTLTEVEDVGSNGEYLRARIVDPTGTFFVYAGQYQPEAANFLRPYANGDKSTPTFVSITGKPRTYETDDGETNISLRPENISVVDRVERDRWVYEAAAATMNRLLAAGEGSPSDGSDASLYDEYDLLTEVNKMVIEALEDLDESRQSISSGEESEGESDADAEASA